MWEGGREGEAIHGEKMVMLISQNAERKYGGWFHLSYRLLQHVILFSG